ncbi:MAG TPA: Uma2 family endonuclease [Pyrinomonadaceae bacterium]|nr:Uma2 family endonuclease [Pyrinomonadaceae bacterium]
MAVNPETLQSHSTYLPTEPVTLDFHGAPLTEEQFEELCRNSPDLNFELSSKGELIIVPPTSPEASWRNSDLTAEVTFWSRKDKTGIVFDSSGMFTLPNGAKRSPDVSWMTREKWDALSPSERKRFSHVVPDFVIELLSPSDNLADTQAKMAEYIENGVRLGWLIDPMDKKVHVYCANGDVEILDDPEMVSGEDVLKGFELRVREIW